MMLAPVRTCPSVIMSFNSSQSSPPKRPRLSLQIKTPATPQVLGKSVTALKADIDPSSPTAFNTLSNAYAAAIENSSPKTARPLSDSKSGKPTFLRLETSNVSSADKEYVHPSQRTQTPGPFSITYPDTPTSAYSHTPITTQPETEGLLKPTSAANSFTFTPPQSAGSDQSAPRVFTFAANDGAQASPRTPRTPRRRMTIGSQYQAAPYTHPRSLHSILRNSPLPPRTSATPATPSRMSLRLASRAAKKVGYNDPLTQTITTNKYVKSHIDLLAEESPYSATDPEAEKLGTLDLTMAYTGDETRDGGQTPGPFEEMRRRMAESGLETPGAKKRKRREKKRKWEWTISSAEGEEEEEGREAMGRTPLTAVSSTPITAVRRGASVSEGDMSESEPEERYMPSVSEDSEMSDDREEWGGSVRSEPERGLDDEDARPRTAQSL
ncbi:related to glucan 1,4-alpha-glucosidase [Phialocephala subalpina]|uniref:Related to glucan 1,4-alpha-glucosidase n=1 Tax=Phialocephala subalpina TaxID=576137 RepID=A0A1L7WKC2_9HELO|nr:related to glucan 1,4-alpha-glucosidase [Phialocephala subalpina]